MLTDLQIAFIGGGTMGEMIITRLLSTKIVPKPDLIIVSDPVSARCLHLEREYIVPFSSNVHRTDPEVAENLTTEDAEE